MTVALARSVDEQPVNVRPNAVVATLAFAGIVVSLMQTLVIPLAPELPRLLGASPSDTSWAITATLLAAAVATPTMGRLGDMYGKRRMLLLSVVMLVVGSAVCAVASNLLLMVVGRALQGLASGVIPLGISVMRDELPAERLAGSTALMSASLGVGGALGLPAAAFGAQETDWHVLFWTSAGLGAVATVLVVTLVPESRVRTGGQFDLLGALGMSVALLCLLLAISKGGDWGWGSRLTLGLFGAAVVILLGWGWWELRSGQPLVDLRISARRQVLLTNIASVVFGFAMFAMSLAFPQLVELPTATGYGLGQSILVAGLTMAPGGLLMIATAPVAARISRSMGPKVTLMVGAVVVAAGYGLSLWLMSTVWQLMIGSAVVSAGIGLAYGAMPALVMGAVPISETAAANSLNTLMRSIGTSTSSAVAGVILAHLTTRLGSVTVPAKSAFQVILIISVGAALGAFLIAVFLPRRRRAMPQDASQVAPAVPAAPEDTSEAPAITGTVRTSGGNAAPGAVITVTDPGGAQVGRTHADAQGQYRVEDLPSGVYTVIVSAPGFAPAAVSVRLTTAGAKRDFELAGAGTVTGMVRRSAAGEQVSGAMVVATDAVGRVVGTTTSAEDGTFQLTKVPVGRITVVAQLPNHRPHAVTVTVAGTEQAVVDLFLEAIGRLYGTVSGPDGTALPNATVSVTTADGTFLGSALTDADGHYELRGLAPGEYTVVTSLYSPAVRHVRLVAGKQATVDFLLAAQDPRTTGSSNPEQSTMDGAGT